MIEADKTDFSRNFWFNQFRVKTIQVEVFAALLKYLSLIFTQEILLVRMLTSHYWLLFNVFLQIVDQLKFPNFVQLKF